MTTVAAIKCSRDAEHHSGTLRKDGDGYICQECYDKEHLIERKKSEGRPVRCPKCGETLMTRRRGGGVSITKLSMKGATATLECDCGYRKTIKNPFGEKQQNRDEVAMARLKAEAHKSTEKKEDNSGSQGD